MSTDNTNGSQHWRERAAQMRLLAVKMAGSQAAILINDLAVHYDELADQAALKEAARKGKSRINGKRQWTASTIRGGGKLGVGFTST